MRKTKKIKVGNVEIGGDSPVVVQSMTNTKTSNVQDTVNQILSLQDAGCEIIRLTVNTEEAARSLPEIKSNVKIPIIADIHFNYKLAIQAFEFGADGIRINPGNIGSEKNLAKIIDCAKMHNGAIRVGINSGSLEKELLKKYGTPCSDALVESAIKWIDKFEKRGFYNLKVSLKSSSVVDTISAYEKFSQISDYPLHVGITEAGYGLRGIIKSSVGIGVILSKGIGDTIRVSLTGDPKEEVFVAWEILKSLGLRFRGPDIISCPTCGRTEIDVEKIAKIVEKEVREEKAYFKIAVMGCVVNGPGEAKDADIGIAGGENLGVIFKKGKVVKKVYGEGNLIDEFLFQLRDFIRSKKKEDEVR